VARTIAKDYSEKRGQILKTAAQVFAEHGFDRASMSQLAKACGISKANIYHYYDGKDALLYDLLDRYLLELRDRLAAVNGAGQDPQQHLRALITEVLLAYQGADAEHSVQSSSLRALPPEQQKTLRGYQRDMVLQMSAAVKSVAPQKFTDDKIALHEVTMSVFGMLNWHYMWSRDNSTEARSSYAARVSDLVLHGITG
jgi:AcrR family transcriptional regulator